MHDCTFFTTSFFDYFSPPFILSFWLPTFIVVSISLASTTANIVITNPIIKYIVCMQTDIRFNSTQLRERKPFLQDTKQKISFILFSTLFLVMLLCVCISHYITFPFFTWFFGYYYGGLVLGNVNACTPDYTPCTLVNTYVV